MTGATDKWPAGAATGCMHTRYDRGWKAFKHGARRPARMQ
jgi:hypothetical protein